MITEGPENSTSAPAWDHHAPYVMDVKVDASHLDHLDHTNNVAYLRWLEDVAWLHSESVGLDWSAYQQLGVCCVVYRHELDYLAATYAGQKLGVATWVAKNDGRVSLWRGYQILRYQDNITVLRGHSRYVCAGIENGRPCRMPPVFRERYAVIEP